MGEGRSFLGETFVNSVRLVGVPTTESDCLLWWAGERHALVSFSPRMRRPSLIGLKGIVVDCIMRRMWDQLRSGEVLGSRESERYTPWRGGSGLGTGTGDRNRGNTRVRDTNREGRGK